MSSAPYQPPLPAPGANVDWGAGFGQRFIVTVDTEEEFDWSAPLSRDNIAVNAAAALPDAAMRLSDGGAVAAFLIDYPIVNDARAIDCLYRAIAGTDHRVGTQLHPWVNPPFDEAVTPANSFAGNLPPVLEAAKIDELTAKIADNFGQPVIYRAGRYGIGPATLQLLAERGYRFDTSIRAAYDYSSDGGPDFTGHGNTPFRCGPDSAIVELPLTTVFTGALRRWGAQLYRRAAAVPHGPGLLARTGALTRVSLTPEAMPVRDALEAVRVAVGAGEPLLNLGFHSPSLVPGHTPYVRDDNDLKAFWRWWDEVLALLAQLGVRRIGIDELLAASRSSPYRDASLAGL